MDPLACLKRLQHAIDSAQYAEAVAALNDYYQWRVRGGFEPPSGDTLANTLANRLADSL